MPYASFFTTKDSGKVRERSGPTAGCSEQAFSLCWLYQSLWVLSKFPSLTRQEHTSKRFMIMQKWVRNEWELNIHDRRTVTTSERGGASRASMGRTHSSGRRQSMCTYNQRRMYVEKRNIEDPKGFEKGLRFARLINQDYLTSSTVFGVAYLIDGRA